MKLSKRLLTSSAVTSALALLASLYIRLVFATSRVTVLGAFPEEAHSRPYLLAFWHGRLMMMPMLSRAFTRSGRKVSVMISTHRDGELIARTMTWFGFGAVRGSSRRGGTEVARAARRVLDAGGHIAITPDGPKGPARKVQRGIIALTRITGAPILPASFAAKPCKRFGSWDGFVLAYPFSRLVMVMGDPVTGGPEELEAALNRLTEQAEDALKDPCSTPSTAP